MGFLNPDSVSVQLEWTVTFNAFLVFFLVRSLSIAISGGPMNWQRGGGGPCPVSGVWALTAVWGGAPNDSRGRAPSGSRSPNYRLRSVSTPVYYLCVKVSNKETSFQVHIYIQTAKQEGCWSLLQHGGNAWEMCLPVFLLDLVTGPPQAPPMLFLFLLLFLLILRLFRFKTDLRHTSHTQWEWRQHSTIEPWQIFKLRPIYLIVINF